MARALDNLRLDMHLKRSPTMDATGLYDPSYEHDACGVGFVAHIKGGKSHAIV